MASIGRQLATAESLRKEGGSLQDRVSIFRIRRQLVGSWPGAHRRELEEGGVVVDDALPVVVQLLNLHLHLVQVYGSGLGVQSLGFRV